MLGSVLALWLNQPGVGYTPKRGVVGFTRESGGDDRPARHDRFAVQDRRGVQAGLRVLHRVLARRAAGVPGHGEQRASRPSTPTSSIRRSTTPRWRTRCTPARHTARWCWATSPTSRTTTTRRVKYWQAAADRGGDGHRLSRRAASGARQHRERVPQHRARRRRRRSRRRSRRRRRRRTRTRSSSPFRARRGTYLYGGRQNLRAGAAASPATRRPSAKYLRRHAHEPVGVRVPGSAQRGGDGGARRIATPTRPSCSRTCCS